MKISVASFDHFEFKNGRFLFHYLWDDKFKFTHQVKIRGINQPKNDWSAAAFTVGLARFPYYFARANPKKVVVRAGKMTPAQIKIWHDWYLKGLGQFFYTNRLPFKINLINTGQKIYQPSKKPLSGFLLLNGGGKDSAVSAELLKRIKTPFKWLVLGTNTARKSTIQNSGITDVVEIQGTSDRSVKSTQQSLDKFYHGHQPLSVYLAALGSLTSELTANQNVITSNEKSANVSNLHCQGFEINHQYTKTFEFEKQFHQYTQKYLNPNFNYFSLLRPLYELQIVKIFSNFPQYHQGFISCNQNIKKGTWCNRCSKCAFIYLSLYPFIETRELTSIFGKNLLDDKDLLDQYLKLTGQKDHKPFDCVGTVEESLAAMYLASKKPSPPFIVSYFINNIKDLTKGEKLIEEIMENYDNHNLIPTPWQKKIKKNIQNLLRS